MTGLPSWSKNGWMAIVSLICLSVITLLLPCSVIAQNPPPNAKWRLTKINFEGLKSQIPDKMIAITGLQIGQTIDFEMVKASAQRLSQTGLFKKVEYRYRYSSTQIELTFDLEEITSGKNPCQFDNFVWFSDQEIGAAIKRDLPDFDGSIVVSDFMADEVKKSVARLLTEKKIAGEVSYELDDNLSYIFKVNGAKLQICDFQFAGAQENLKKPLFEALQPLVKTEYSRSDTRLFVEAALIPIYTQRGYLKAAFKQSQPSIGASGACANSVVVTLPVVEGMQYRWNNPVWSGNQACSAQELNAALRLKPGDVADLMKIKGGWVDVRLVFGKKGHLKTRLKPESVFEDARQLVTYHVEINEGPQYRMGQLIIAGLPDDEARRAKDAWGLKAGEVYDTSYITVWRNKIAREGMIKLTKGMKAGHELKTDDQKLIVDVVVKFER
jgi:outer membrane protein assembly factor BamA